MCVCMWNVHGRIENDQQCGREPQQHTQALRRTQPFRRKRAGANLDERAYEDRARH